MQYTCIKQVSSHHDVIFEQNGEVEVTNLTERFTTPHYFINTIIVCIYRVVSSESELLSVVSEGVRHRATHYTNIHKHSSRSHLIVTVHVTTGGDEECISSSSSGTSLQLNTTITPVTSNDSTPMVSCMYFCTLK